MQEKFLSIFRQITEITILVLALFYKIIINFFFWVIIFLAINVFYYQKIDDIMNDIDKFGNIRTQEPKLLPDLELNPNLFSKNKEQKLTEINNYLSKITSFTGMTTKYKSLKQTGDRNFMQVDVNATFTCSFVQIVKLLDHLRQIGYMINSIKIENIIDSEEHKTTINFSALYYE